jgi:LAO/AO transport system kinase
MEMADLVLVNKADGALAAEAARTRADYAGALRLMRPHPGDPQGYPRAMTVSAHSGDGMDAAWSAIETLAAARRESGAWEARRRAQAEAWFASAVETGLLARLAADPDASARRRALSREIADGRITPDAAAEALLDAFAPLRGGATPGR